MSHTTVAFKLVTFTLVTLITVITWITCSEFPERECCDPVYPPPIPTAPSSSTATPTGRSGPNIKTAIAIFNCLLARQLCYDDVSCSAILEIIPRVCGPELVACSTVTVTKCQAALRTLQAFPFFKPTCLCREPLMDPECNSFRDFLFDHPCLFVNKKEKDPYPVDALPACNHALAVCQKDERCLKLFDDFKSNCKVRDNKCRMENRNACHESWMNLRMLPVFGCICPNNHMKRRCEKIFTAVNHNPCVDMLPITFDLSGTDSALYPSFDPGIFLKTFWHPPSTRSNIILLDPGLDMHEHPPEAPALTPPSNRHHTHHIPFVNVNTSSKHAGGSRGRQHSTRTGFDLDAPRHHHNGNGIRFEPYNNTFNYNYYDANNDVSGGVLHPRLPHFPPINVGDVKHQHDGHLYVQLTRFATGSTDVKVISATKNSSRAFAYEIDFEAEFKNPLVDLYGIDMHHKQLLDSHLDILGYDTSVSPYNKTSIHANQNQFSSPEVIEFQFKSTCHVALDNCNKEPACRSLLLPVLNNCDLSRCNREQCMDALQGFYRNADTDWSLEVAFCLCKKMDAKQDACLVAQEKLHPVCAQRIEGEPLPTCHSLAEDCRKNKDCRALLEHYEQSCAVDSVTKKCAGPPAECRRAMLGILGTELRSTCSCKGIDYIHLYDCLGWQRLLWVNPCVVESQTDFHIKKDPQAHEMMKTTTFHPSTTVIMTTQQTYYYTMNVTSMLTTRETTPTPTQPTTTTETPQTIATERVTIPSTQPTTLSTTTTTLVTTTTPSTTIAPRFCVVQRRDQPDQYIIEGNSKRLYRDNELECSELCQCGKGESLVCHTICVDRVPCKTDFAFYNHAAPAYQAYRGRCLCYSGQFICMRPLPDTYSLQQGVYLFLGFSETDEQLLKPHSNLSVQDVVYILQDFIYKHIDNKTICELTLFNITKANVILEAKAATDTNEIDVIDLTAEQQDECASILRVVSEKINSQQPEFTSHLFLSIFKMADVEVVRHKVSASVRHVPCVTFMLVVMFRWFCHALT